MELKDDALTEIEIENVSKEISDDRVEDLVREMEMEYSLEEAKKDRPSQGLAYAVISDFVENEDGTRYKLAQFLKSANFVNTSRK